MNHQQLVEHYAKLLEAKDREEQRTIEELDKPRNKQQDSAFFDAVCDRLGIEPVADDHPIYSTGPFIIFRN